jgi:hypothetical protein
MLTWLLLGLVLGQHPSAPRAAAGTPVHVAPPEAKQFDFLVGEWNVVARLKATGLAQRIHGAPRIAGTWNARRALDGWGIEDDLKLIDGSGNPLSLAHAVRVYDAAAKQWTQTSLDVYRGRFTPSTAEWRDGAMVVTSRGTDPEGRAFVARTRYYDISPTGFKFQQDRSYDDGRTWEEAVLRIEAKR